MCKISKNHVYADHRFSRFRAVAAAATATPVVVVVLGLLMCLGVY